MDTNLPTRDRLSTLVQEETKSTAENKFQETEKEKLVQGGKITDDSIEEDIIIKCELDEMVKRFFKDYAIIWHDPNVNSEENQQYITQLEKFCEVHTFTDWQKASIYAVTVKAAYHVITSGTNGELLVREIGSNENVLRIYVFCVNRDSHLAWTKNYERISCVEIKIQSILDQLKENLLRWFSEKSSLKSNLPVFAPIFNDWDKSGMNNLHRYLKVIPKFKNRLQAKKDIIGLSRAVYSDENNRSFISSFDNNYNEYNKEMILKLYTQESFFSKIVNNCLRIASSDSIQYCRLFLKDLERAIKNEYRRKSKNFNGLLYRGAYLSEKEWLSLKANFGREIETHGFLSASKDKNLALKFTESDPNKKVFITILIPKAPSKTQQGFAEVEEFSEFPKEQEILFNVRSRFTILEAEEKYSKDLPYRHLVLFYGAQDFRKYVTKKNPGQEIFIPEVKNISCSTCPDPTPQKILFTPFGREQTQKLLCKKCVPDFLKADNAPLLCIPMMMDKKKQRKQIYIQGILMTYPAKSEVPMYGYKCCECQAKRQRIYYKCTECYCETKKVWCEDCFDSATICIKAEHYIVLESKPFSFWCDKMSQKELDHFRFQKIIIDWAKRFLQGGMYIHSDEYQKAISYYKIYISRNKEKKKDLHLECAYLNVACIFQSQGKLDKAFKNFSKALEVAKSRSRDIEVAFYYSKMGSICTDQVQYQKALEYHSKAFEIIKSTQRDKKDQLVAVCYSNMGKVYQHQAQHKKALEYYSKVLEIEKSFYGDNHPCVATSLSNLGNVYCCQAQNEKALEYCSEALEINRSFHGDYSTEVADCCSNMGSVYHDQAQYQKALECHFKALGIMKSFYGGNHPRVATCYCNLADVYQSQAEFEKALEYVFRALEIDKSFYGENHPDIAMCYRNIGSVYSLQAEYQKALEYYSKALKIAKSFYGDNHPLVAACYERIGVVSFDQQEYQKAFEYYSKALDIRKSIYGDNHPLIAACYNNMALVYGDRAEYENALKSSSKALEISKSFYGNNHPDIAIFYDSMGSVYNKQAEYRKALEYCSKALDIRKSIYGDRHPLVGGSYHTIGEIYYEQAEFQTAFEYHSKSLEIIKSFYGNNHPRVAACYGSMGDVYYQQFQYQTALEYNFKALEIQKSFHGDNHLKVAVSYASLGDIYNCQAQYQKALEYLFKALEIVKSYFGDKHPDIAALYNKIGNVYFFQAREILETPTLSKLLSGEMDPNATDYAHNIPIAGYQAKEYRKAAEYHVEALKIYKSLFGEKHPCIGASFRYLAIICNHWGFSEKELEFNFKAWEIFQSFFGDNHPVTISIARSMCDF